jgi:hypothetical protein
MNAIARRRPGDMLSKTITVTTEPGLVNATANPRPAISGVSVPTVLPPSRQQPIQALHWDVPPHDEPIGDRPS